MVTMRAASPICQNLARSLMRRAIAAWRSEIALDEPRLVTSAIRFVGFVVLAPFGKVWGVIFAADCRIDALAQVPRFRNLVIQISERVSKQRR